MSDGLSNNITTFVGIIATGIIVHYLKRLETQGKRAAEKVAQVVVQAAQMSDVITDTHVLVNSNMGIQLRLNAELSRWKAEQTKLPADVQAANLADNMLRDHEHKQSIVDAHKSARADEDAKLPRDETA